MDCQGTSWEVHVEASFNHLEKYESQWEGLSDDYGKINQMFQSANQLYIALENCPFADDLP
jgi:hypothetical protein